MSDHIIHAKSVYTCKVLAMLFTGICGLMVILLRHCVDCRSTISIAPIPKGRWANLGESSNFRAITIGSMLGKVLELVFMNRTQHHDNAN